MDERPANHVRIVLCIRTVISAVGGMLLVVGCTSIADTAKFPKLHTLVLRYHDPKDRVKLTQRSGGLLFRTYRRNHRKQKYHRPHVVARLDRIQVILYHKARTLKGGQHNMYARSEQIGR